MIMGIVISRLSFNFFFDYNNNNVERLTNFIQN
jgi:hypothetical protein